MKDKISLLDLVQFSGSILVILVHCGQLVDDQLVHFILKSFLGRMAVPMFLICNGYFFTQQPAKQKDWQKKQIHCYLKLSLAYLPLGFFELQKMQLPVYLLPAALLIGLIYIGSYYHLWYFPALLTGTWLIQKLGRCWWLWVLLYLLGCSETYSYFLIGTPAEPILSSYLQVFFTSRNGLFYVPLFLLLGRRLAKADRSVAGRFLIPALLLLVAENVLIYHHQGIDKNFFLAMPLFSYCLMAKVFSSKWQFSCRLPLRRFSQQLFFWHPWSLFLIQTLTHFSGITLFATGLAVTLSGCLLWFWRFNGFSQNSDKIKTG